VSSSPGQDPEPPELPGYRFIRHIGTGGNAKVYLYEQELPSRKVAVKVLNDSALSEVARRRFTAEANVTAVLAHRHIVQVFDAKVTDDGRPYIVMPFYPQPNLSVRAGRARFSVAEVLRIGIQIGSAVETSHRNGVLHRDIKPQNILTDSYGEPALTDFGIATTTLGDGPEGLSVPWSPPEILNGTGPGDQRSDVYSLGATLWHLLVGRPPFEQQDGGSNTVQLMQRINAEPPPRTQRADVPDSLERLLRQTMAKDIAARPQSAIELIRGLQSIEQELRLPLTQPILLVDEPDERDAGGDTVVRPAAHGGEAAPRAAAHQGEPAVVPAAVLSADQLAEPALAQPAEKADTQDATILRGGRPAVTRHPAAMLTMPRRRRIVALAGVGLLAVVAGVAAVLTLPHGGGGQAAASAGTGQATQQGGQSTTAAPTTPVSGTSVTNSTTAAPTIAAPTKPTASASAEATVSTPAVSATLASGCDNCIDYTAGAVASGEAETVTYCISSGCRSFDIPVAGPGEEDPVIKATETTNNAYNTAYTITAYATGPNGDRSSTVSASVTTGAAAAAQPPTSTPTVKTPAATPTVTVTMKNSGACDVSSPGVCKEFDYQVSATVTNFPPNTALTFKCSPVFADDPAYPGGTTNASGSATFYACSGAFASGVRETVTVAGGGISASGTGTT
jgi:tRNA A-37 threonylcarbamoyl transferase component Bud32